MAINAAYLHLTNHKQNITLVNSKVPLLRPLYIKTSPLLRPLDEKTSPLLRPFYIENSPLLRTVHYYDLRILRPVHYYNPPMFSVLNLSFHYAEVSLN